MPSYLKVRRPSPTTASFTVSNASQCTSTPAKALFYLQFLLRACIFVSVLVVCAARLRSSFFAKNGSWVRWTAVWASPLGELACRIADEYSPLVVTVGSVIALYGVFRKGYTGAFYLGIVRIQGCELTIICWLQKSRFLSYGGWGFRRLLLRIRICPRLRRGLFLPLRFRIL